MWQARRLVKNSIIAVEAPDEDVGEEGFVDDAAEFADVLGRHQSGDGNSGAQGADAGEGESGAADGASQTLSPDVAPLVLPASCAVSSS